MLIVSYRRIFQLGFKVNKVNGTLAVFDYLATTFFYQDDMTPML